MYFKKEDFENPIDWAEYLGNYAHKRFEEECSSRNLISFHPTEQLRYDSVVEINGKFKRVQVKGVSLEKKSKSHRVPLSSNTRITGKRITYTTDEIDYFAFYLVENDTMYFVPAHIMLKVSTDRVYVYDSDFYTPKHSRTAIDIKKYKKW